MSVLISLFLLLVSVVLTFGLIIILILLLRDQLKVKVPFVPTRKRALAPIVQALEIKPGDVIFDLGCGDGRILRAVSKSVSGIRAVGVERGVIPYLVSSLLNRGTDIETRFCDLTEVNLGEATHIYCYLFPELMNILEPKIIREASKGTQIVACDYKFPTLPPKEVIPMTTKAHDLARTLYVYEM